MLPGASVTRSPRSAEGLPVCLEGPGEVDDGAVLLDGVDDGLGPVQPPDGGRVQRGEERQVRVEVVVLPQELHHLHELEDQPLPLLWVVLLEDARPGFRK